VYVLVKPTNLAKKAAASGKGGKKQTSAKGVASKLKNKKKPSSKNRVSDEAPDDTDPNEDEADEDDDNENEDDEEDTRKSSNSKPSTSNKTNANTTQISSSNNNNSGDVEQEPQAIPIKFRVSTLVQDTNSDLKLTVTPSQTVASLKKQLCELTNIEPANQRMFFGGKLMRDKERLRVHKLKKNVVIQVIVRPSKSEAAEVWPPAPVIIEPQLVQIVESNVVSTPNA
jgi:hypothetical protein